MINLKINLNRKQCLLLLINGFCILFFLLLTAYAGNTAGDLYSQRGAERWEEKDNSYAQVSAFLSSERNTLKEEIGNIRSSLVETLSKDSYGINKGTGRVWLDAYSGECQAEVRNEYNTVSVAAVGVGGDFFRFHPIPLLSGSYIFDEDLNNDRIVVDEGFAWAMFGSNDIVGMQVWMGNTIYVIAGVVAVEENMLYQTAYGNTNRIYMSYDQLKRQQEGLKITCYEAVLPNPISNYAYYALRKACGMVEEEEEETSQEVNPMNFEDIEVIENSRRFKVMPLLTKAKTLTLRSMRTNSIGYPYWENIARVIEEQQIILLVLRGIFLIFPCICFVLWIYGLWQRRSWTAKGIVLGWFDRIRKKRERREEALDAEESGDLDSISEEGNLGEQEALEEDESLEKEKCEQKEEAERKGEAEKEDGLRIVTSEDIFVI